MSIVKAAMTSQLIPMREGSGDLPLFCLGDLNFASLVPALDVDQAIYGLRILGIDAAGSEATVADLARLHLEQIRRVQPRGPYRLLGYSFGGLLAYDIARQLIEAGEPIALLALFDTPNPLFREGLSAAERTAAKQKYLEDRKRKYWQNLRSGRWDRLALDLVRLANKALHPVVLRFAKLLGRRAAPLPPEARIKALWHSYVPRPLDVRLVLFRAEGRDAEFGEDESMGWRRCVTRGVEVHFAGGIHEEMMQSPYAARLATQVMPYLTQTPQQDIARHGTAHDRVNEPS
jgi:thioesterase domain-containing protein